jgi:sulfatase maturation enzyme AslB (radical SAM superfamily)
MERKLEITRKLEMMGRAELKRRVAILNLPAPFHCTKKCTGCIARGKTRLEAAGKKDWSKMKPFVEYFSDEHGTRFISINGRGDPFHPSVRDETMEKIRYVRGMGIQSLVFSSGDNLDDEVIGFLIEHEVNVMISLFGNGFVDAELFDDKRYGAEDRKIADSVMKLVKANGRNLPRLRGTTRVGMNYVLSPGDLQQPSRMINLRKAAVENDVFFICNLNFVPEKDEEVRERLMVLAEENSNFRMHHSTEVDGVCRMGAGSSLTIAANGDIYLCPYMFENSDGNVFELSLGEIRGIIEEHRGMRPVRCVLRDRKR